MQHLLRRLREREITLGDLETLLLWLDTKPEVPDGEWYKRFSRFTVCGKGSLVRTFLTARQTPVGVEV